MLSKSSRPYLRLDADDFFVDDTALGKLNRLRAKLDRRNYLLPTITSGTVEFTMAQGTMPVARFDKKAFNFTPPKTAGKP